MILDRSGLCITTILLFGASFALAGCAHEDKRLTSDEQSCRSMGHSPGSAAFDQCMKDLNQRRCGTINYKGASRHATSLDCTRL